MSFWWFCLRVWSLDSIRLCLIAMCVNVFYCMTRVSILPGVIISTETDVVSVIWRIFFLRFDAWWSSEDAINFRYPKTVSYFAYSASIFFAFSIQNGKEVKFSFLFNERQNALFQKLSVVLGKFCFSKKDSAFSVLFGMMIGHTKANMRYTFWTSRKFFKVINFACISMEWKFSAKTCS